MSYSPEFKESALKECRKLDSAILEQFKKKLAERLERPRVESAKLSLSPNEFPCAPRTPFRSSSSGTV